MQRAFRLSLFKAAVTGSLLCASPAFAHIDLLEPEARAHGTGGGADTDVDANSNQKSGPCGESVSLGRGDRIATYAPGSTITVRVREEIDHDSYIRILLDLDGEDFVQRPTVQTAPETEEVARAAEESLGNDYLLAVVRETNSEDEFTHEIDVTLPDETCESCTLQVIQFMYGAPNPFYFQCADIVIAEGGEGADAGVEPDEGAGAADAGAGGSASSGMAGAGGAGGASMAAAGATNAGAGNPGSAGSDSMSDDEMANDEPSDDEGGCSVSSGPGGSAASGLFGLLVLALAGRRRRR